MLACLRCWQKHMVNVLNAWFHNNRWGGCRPFTRGTALVGFPIILLSESFQVATLHGVVVNGEMECACVSRFPPDIFSPHTDTFSLAVS